MKVCPANPAAEVGVRKIQGCKAQVFGEGFSLLHDVPSSCVFSHGRFWSYVELNVGVKCPSVLVGLPCMHVSMFAESLWAICSILKSHVAGFYWSHQSRAPHPLHTQQHWEEDLYEWTCPTSGIHGCWFMALTPRFQQKINLICL